MKLTDFPEYALISDKVQALRTEEQQITARVEAIGIELSKPKPRVDGQDAWQRALEGGEYSNSIEIDPTSSLREELSQLEGRLRFVQEALTIGVQELDRVRGKYSLEICQTIRPTWVAQVKIILENLKALSAANQALDDMRAELEANGVASDSLPFSKYDIGGKWNDPFGGKIVGYQRSVTDAFPELASAAGQEIKAKLRAIAERERQYNQERPPL